VQGVGRRKNERGAIHREGYLFGGKYAVVKELFVANLNGEKWDSLPHSTSCIIRLPPRQKASELVSQFVRLSFRVNSIILILCWLNPKKQESHTL
jgi:hypothetical protein